jgi:U3 small nucleolar RNA-associated protein 13
VVLILLLTHASQQVWALIVSRDNKTIVSGAADSVVTFWEDCSEEQDAARETARAELVLKYVMCFLVASLTL